MAVFFPQGSLTMQDVKKKKKRQTTSASEVIADLFIVSDTHLSLPLSLMQYETVPELHAVKENLIYTYKTRH